MITIHPSDKPAIITGCMGGILTSLCNISFVYDIIHNIFITAVGATVSFIVSYFLTALFKRKK